MRKYVVNRSKSSQFRGIYASIGQKAVSSYPLLNCDIIQDVPISLGYVQGLSIRSAFMPIEEVGYDKKSSVFLCQSAMVVEVFL